MPAPRIFPESKANRLNPDETPEPARFVMM
jgi:hypothetical protein